MSGVRPFLDERAQAEALVQLAGQQLRVEFRGATVTSDAGLLGVEGELDRARFRVTHRVVPSAPARNP